MISLSLQPTAHRRTFQRSLVRPSTSCYRGLGLAMGSSHGLRVHHAQLVGAGVFPRPPSHVSHSLSLRLPALRLTLLRMVTRGLIMQKACRNLSAATACGHAISGLFHSPHGVLFTFPSRYSFTIGHRRVFRLGEWAPRIQAGFHVSRPTQDTADYARDSGTGLSPSVAGLSRPFPFRLRLSCRRPTTPGGKPPGLACSAFARHYLRNLV